MQLIYQFVDNLNFKISNAKSAKDHLDKKNATHLVLHIQGDLTLPLPGLMKKMIAPVVEGEFEKLVEQYIDNLTKQFGGEV